MKNQLCKAFCSLVNDELRFLFVFLRSRVAVVAAKTLQGDHVDPTKRLYSGVVDCARKTMAEGAKAFYKGFTPSIARAMPVNGAIFTGFTAAQRALA